MIIRSLVSITLSFFVLFPSAAGAEDSTRAFTLPRTQVIDIVDSQTQRNYELYIQLPNAYFYSENRETIFPTIYITDASYNFPVVEGFSRIPMNQEIMQPAIIVGISWEVGANPIDSRVRDYTPTINKEFKRKTGEAGNHLRFIGDDVFSYVESNFRASTNNRTYIGYSLGGLLGSYALLTQPDMFSNYVLVSPSLWYDERHALHLASNNKRPKSKSHTRIYISVGELETPEHVDIKNDMVADAQAFYRKIQDWNSENVEVRLHIVEDAIHEIAFPEPVAKALYWILKKPE